MTLILAAAEPAKCVLVGDRLVTLRSAKGYAGIHHDQSNKSLVVVTSDAVLLIGYAGAAYLERKPTDHWIAELIWGDEIPAGTIYDNRPRQRALKAQDIINKLRLGLGNTRHGESVTLLICGLRNRKRSSVPVIYELRGAKKLGPDARLKTRAWIKPKGQGILGHVGANVDQKGIVEPLMDEYRKVGKQPTSEFLEEVIRRTADVDPTVGKETMVIAANLYERKIRIKFGISPDKVRLEAAFSPWIICRSYCFAPTEARGTGFPFQLTASHLDIEVIQPDYLIAPPDIQDGLPQAAFSVFGQPRRPPP